MVKTTIPKDWIGCPSKGDHLVESKFVVFKTPLSKSYDGKLSADDRFYPEDLFYNADEKPGLWIDLTNTDRYYSKSDIEEQGCIYKKIQCHGHGSFPKTKHVDKFISTVQQFLRDSPDGRIGVHCTHGFNRTGFMIVSFMVVVLKHNVADAIESFAKARPPGIYRQNYILELLQRHGRFITVPPTLTLKAPSWIGNPRSSNIADLRRSSCNRDLQSSNPTVRRPKNGQSRNLARSSGDGLHYERYDLPQERLDACTAQSESSLPHRMNQDPHTRESYMSQLNRADHKGSGPCHSPWRSIDPPRETDSLNNNPTSREPDLLPSSIDYSKRGTSDWPLLSQTVSSRDSYPEPVFLPQRSLDTKPPKRCYVSRYSRNRLNTDAHKRESDSAQSELEDRPRTKTSDISLSSGNGPFRSPENRQESSPYQRGVGLYRLCPQQPDSPREKSAFHSYTKRSGTCNQQKKS